MKGPFPKLGGAALLLLAAGCADAEWSDDAIPLAEATVEGGEFFPERLYRGRDTYDRNPVLDEFSRGYYSAALSDADERPLVALAKAGPADGLQLRFIWLPSFHNPAVITVSTTTQGQRRLVAKRILTPWTEDAAKPDIPVNRMLTDEESARLDQVIERSQVLSQPARDPRASGLDGSRWVVEAADGEAYHLVTRWSPEDGPVREVGTVMIGLTGWKLEEIY